MMLTVSLYIDMCRRLLELVRLMSSFNKCSYALDRGLLQGFLFPVTYVRVLVCAHVWATLDFLQ